MVADELDGVVGVDTHKGCGIAVAGSAVEVQMVTSIGDSTTAATTV